MSQKRTDAVRCLRGKDVFELAGLFGDLVFVLHMKGMDEQPLCQTMSADNVFRALAALFGEVNHVVAVAGIVAAGPQRVMATVEDLLVRVGFAGMRFQL